MTPGRDWQLAEEDEIEYILGCVHCVIFGHNYLLHTAPGGPAKDSVRK